jgi:hypothetical protein
MTDLEFIRLTHEMRTAQVAFFRSQDDKERRRLLRESKRLEMAVDAELRWRAPDIDQPNGGERDATPEEIEQVEGKTG